MAVDLRGSIHEKKELNGAIRTIEIGTGDKLQRWTVHETLLCQNSAFFKAAVKQQWTTHEDRAIPMPEDDPDVFGIYMQWLYGNKLLVQDHDEDQKKSSELGLLVECFILGEKLQDKAFQDATIDSMIACVNTPNQEGTIYFPANHADRVYEGTPEASPLRLLIVDMFVYHGRAVWVGSNADTDFLADLSRKLLDIRDRPGGSSPINLSNAMVYHQ